MSVSKERRDRGGGIYSSVERGVVQSLVELFSLHEPSNLFPLHLALDGCSRSERVISSLYQGVFSLFTAQDRQANSSYRLPSIPSGT